MQRKFRHMDTRMDGQTHADYFIGPFWVSLKLVGTSLPMPSWASWPSQVALLATHSHGLAVKMENHEWRCHRGFCHPIRSHLGLLGQARGPSWSFPWYGRMTKQSIWDRCEGGDAWVKMLHRWVTSCQMPSWPSCPSQIAFMTSLATQQHRWKAKKSNLGGCEGEMASIKLSLRCVTSC